MVKEIRLGNDFSIIEEVDTKGLVRLSFYHPEGTFSLTPGFK